MGITEELDKKLDDFYKETGIWPPGRSMPAAMCGGEDKPAIRHRAFQLWRCHKALQAENERLKKFVETWAGHEADCDCLDDGSPRTDCTCGYEEEREEALKDG